MNEKIHDAQSSRQYKEDFDDCVKQLNENDLKIARLRTALREIENYQGNYASDKNPTIRAIKRIAHEAQS